MVEGAPHTTKRSMINCVSRGAPCPRIQRSKGEAGRPLGRAKEGGVLILVGVGLLQAHP